MKKFRIIVPVVLAVAVLGFGALFVGAPETARAVPGPQDGYDFGEDHLQMVSDQEDAVTDADGKVRLCLNEAPVDVDPSDAYTDTFAEPADVTPPSLGGCPDGTIVFEEKARNVNVELAGNLDEEGNGPAFVQTRFHGRDGVVLVFYNTEMKPIRKQNVRFTYDATGTRTPANPNPEPQPTPEPTTEPTPEPTPPTTTEPPSGPLAAQIATLTVAPEGTRDGYARELFGGYSRDALLAASLEEHGCYRSVADDECYAEGTEGEAMVEVDHIVPLAEAWDSGAVGWSAAERDAYGGDGANLWLMTASLNEAKGASDVADWLPPDGGAVCAYVESWVAVKFKYELTVDAAERDALMQEAAGC